MEEQESYLLQEKERLLRKYQVNTIEEVIQKLEQILQKTP